MRMPSLKTLIAAGFHEAPELRRILKMPYSELRQTEPAQARIRECYHPPKKYDVRMHCLDAVCTQSHGVEACEILPGEYADYLNVGEMYAETIIYWRGSYRVQDLGTFLERNQKGVE